MGTRTPVYIVSSPRPRVGKTFVARLAIDFLRLEDRPVGAYDLNPLEPTLAGLNPTLTKIIDISSVRDQMAMFDRLIRADGIPKVVDLGQVSYQEFFSVADQTGFVLEAHRHAVEPIVLFPIDPHPASAGAYARLRLQFPDLMVVPVDNDAVAPGGAHLPRFPVGEPVAKPLYIPRLPAEGALHLDAPNLSFAELHDTLPITIPLGVSLELRAWTRRVFREFRELELRLLLRKLKTSLQASL